MPKAWAELLRTSTASTPNRAKRRNIVMLRGLLVVAVGALLLDASSAGTGALVLVLAFALSDALLPRLPMRYMARSQFELVVGGLDLILVGLGLQLAGVGAGALPVSCLLMVLVVALGGYRADAVAGAAAVGALHAWLVLHLASGRDVGRQLVLQTLFLCSVGLYYGFLVEGLHRLRRRREAEDLERRELTTLLEILDDVTSSLDLRKVTASIVGRLTQIVPSERCSIVYVDQELRRCYVLASHDNPALDLLELDLGRYPEIRRAIETRRHVVIEDVCNHPLMAPVRGYLEKLDFHSILVIPLTFGDDVLGTLCLRTARGSREYTDREIKFCTAVACASANALKNALLHRQAIEESLRHRRTGEKLAKILNDSPDLILTTDDDGRIAEFNRGAEKLLGYIRDEVVGKPYTMLVPDDDGGGLLEEVERAGPLRGHARRLRKKSGATVELELHISALRNGEGETAGTVWIGHDVTELKAAQMQLVQAEKLSTIGEVISGVAHELNNPLSAVLGFSELVMTRHGDDRMVRELEKIHEAAQRCQKIVKNLLSFARAHKPERQYLGINGILEKTLDLKKYQLHVNNVEVETDLDPGLPCTMVDFHQMQQVFVNLVHNAQHAMTAVRVRPGRLRVRTRLHDGMIRAEIEDNGEGMDEETLQRIFDPFFTTKQHGEGTGLGLSVSYGIVNEHGGRIWARSRKGEGSTFVVELPVWKEATASPAEEPAEPRGDSPPASPGARILVVDDEPLVLDLLMDVLVDAGYRVDTAPNGSEACRKVNADSYDLVITDVRMPQMNGMDLYRNLLSARPEMRGKVVFVTGDLIDAGILQFLAEIQARTIPKPLEISQVHRIVREVLDPGGTVPRA